MGVDVFTVTGKGYSLPLTMQLLDEKAINAQLEDGRLTVIPVIDSTNQYLMDRMASLQSGTPVWQNISRRGAAGVDGSGFLLLDLICIYQCTGIWNKDRQRQWD